MFLGSSTVVKRIRKGCLLGHPQITSVRWCPLCGSHPKEGLELEYLSLLLRELIVYRGFNQASIDDRNLFNQPILIQTTLWGVLT